MNELIKVINGIKECTPYSNIKPKAKIVLLLDAGHGGMKDDVCINPEKSAPFDNGKRVFCEGIYNRAIAHMMIRELYMDSLSYAWLHHDNVDVSLHTRVKDYNAYSDILEHEGYKTYLLSIHGNAFGIKSANGVEVITSPGYTPADPLATIYYYKLAQLGMKMRPGWADKEDLSADPDKEMDLYILKKTSMPAILTETGFYTNPKEALYMATAQAVSSIASRHVAAHQDIVTLKLLS